MCTWGYAEKSHPGARFPRPLRPGSFPDPKVVVDQIYCSSGQKYIAFHFPEAALDIRSSRHGVRNPMSMETDDELVEIDEEAEDGYLPSIKPLIGNIDARRLIERRLELRRLREQLEDPEFCLEFE
jgi:hypothetical protein